MFDIFSWQHLSIMLIVALVVVGPKDLPRLMNMAGKWAAKARGMASEFRKSFDEMARESELAELRKEIDDLKKNNPITEMSSSLTNAQADIGGAIQAEPSALAPSEPRSGELKVTDTAPQPTPQPTSTGGATAS